MERKLEVLILVAKSEEMAKDNAETDLYSPAYDFVEKLQENYFWGFVFIKKSI